MKRLFFVFLLSFVSVSSFSQSWLQYNSFGVQRQISGLDTLYRIMPSGVGIPYLYFTSKWKYDQSLTGKANTDGSNATGTWGININGNAATVSTINGKISSGSNISITGSGTNASPYTISSTVNPTDTTSISKRIDAKQDDLSSIDFYGKTIYFYGDSYTAGSGASSTGKRYSTIVAKAVGGIEQNFGIAGRTLEKRVPIDYMGAQNMVDGVSTIPTKTKSMSFAVIALGLNDMGQTAPAYNTTNYITDYQTVINNFISKGWKTTQLLIISPYYIGSAGYTAYAGITGNAAPTRARHLSFVQATKDVARQYGTHYIDMFQAQFKNDTTLLSGDNIHPNDLGHAYIANTILRFLNGGLSYGNKINESTSAPISLSLGGSFSNTAGTSSKAKLKVYDDGNDSNTYGIGVSSGSLEFFSSPSATFDFYSGGSKTAQITNNGGLGINSINGLTGTEISSSSNFTITKSDATWKAVTNNASGRSLLLAQNTIGSTAAWMITGPSYPSDLPSNTAVMGGSTGLLIVSNYTAPSGGTDPIILRQGGTASTKTVAITSSGVGINTTTPHSSSAFHVNSTTQGILPPVMSSSQFAAISSKATGLQAYDNTTNRPTVYNGSEVKQIAYLDDLQNTNTVSSAATLTLTTAGYYTFNGTTSTWTLPALTGNTGVRYLIMNQGTGTLTINTNGGGNDIYMAGTSVNMITVGVGEIAVLYNNSLSWFRQL